MGKGGRRDASSKARLGTINVILNTLGRTGSHPSKVMFVAQPPAEDPNFESKRARMESRPALGFSDEDKVGTI